MYLSNPLVIFHPVNASIQIREALPLLNNQISEALISKDFLPLNGRQKQHAKSDLPEFKRHYKICFVCWGAFLSCMVSG